MWAASFALVKHTISDCESMYIFDRLGKIKSAIINKTDEIKLFFIFTVKNYLRIKNNYIFVLI